MTGSRQFVRSAYEEACRAEIEALKPGNVHVFAEGHGMTAEQFVASARVSSGPLTDSALGLGGRIRQAVVATRAAVATNTNLGIVLCAAPLACAAELPGVSLREAVGTVLGGVDANDTRAVFEAIALASPGGLGEAKNDVRQEPKVGLLDAMREAAHRDRIARQYITDFEDVFGIGMPTLERAQAEGETGMWLVVLAYLAFLSAFPDSHVARKHGWAAAESLRDEAADFRARFSAVKDPEARLPLLAGFDRELKSRGLNPGTSADLTVASLFAHRLATGLHSGSVGA